MQDIALMRYHLATSHPAWLALPTACSRVWQFVWSTLPLGLQLGFNTQSAEVFR